MQPRQAGRTSTHTPKRTNRSRNRLAAALHPCALGKEYRLGRPGQARLEGEGANCDAPHNSQRNAEFSPNPCPPKPSQAIGSCKAALWQPVPEWIGFRTWEGARMDRISDPSPSWSEAPLDAIRKSASSSFPKSWI